MQANHHAEHKHRCANGAEEDRKIEGCSLEAVFDGVHSDLNSCTCLFHGASSSSHRQVCCDLMKVSVQLVNDNSKVQPHFSYALAKSTHKPTQKF